MMQIKIYCGLLLVAFGAMACKPSSGVSGPSTRPVVVRLTWNAYTGVENPEQAIYDLDGKKIGSGKAGFLKVLDKLRMLPPNSTLEVTTGFPVEGPSGQSRNPPFSEIFGASDDSLYERLRKVAVERNLRVTIDGEYYPMTDDRHLFD